MAGRLSSGARRGRVAEAVLLEVIAHHLMDIVIVTDAELEAPGPRIVYVNDRFTELTGYTASEVLGRSPRLLQGPDTDRQALDRVRRGLADGVPVVETVVNYGRDGTRYDLEMRIVPLLGADGRPTHFVAIERDVTRERARTAQRQRLEMLLGSVVHALDFGVLVHDKAARCILANAEAVSLLGTAVDGVIGKLLGELLPGYVAASATGNPIAVPLAGKAGAAPVLRVEALPAMPGSDHFTVLRLRPQVTGAAAAQTVAAAPRPSRLVVAGRMQLVGLDAVRQALGARWTERRDAILELAEAVLKRRLGQRDIWRRQGEEGFVVVFAETDERTARFKAEAIAAEIRETLVGQGESGISLATTVAEVAVEEPVDLAAPSLMDTITAAMATAAVALEERVQAQLRTALARPALLADEVRLAAGQLLAHRLRLPEALAENVRTARAALADPSGTLLEVQSFVLAEAVRRLSGEGQGSARPLMLPIDPALMDSRRAWTALLDLARRVPAPLRRRMLPLLDGRRQEDSPYRLSDAAATLGQIFGHAGLVHPCRGGLRFLADRCRLRVVVLDARELPVSAEEQKKFERLLPQLRMTRVKLTLDLTGGPPAAPPPPHDMRIVPSGHTAA